MDRLDAGRRGGRVFVAALILPRAVALLRTSGTILLGATPAGLDLDRVREHMAAQPPVRDVHDLHASTVASGLPVLTAHIVLDEGCLRDGHCLVILQALQSCLGQHHEVAIEHCAIQLESEAIGRGHREHLHA